MDLGARLVSSVVVILAAVVFSVVVRALLRLMLPPQRSTRARFWSQQVVKLFATFGAVALLAGIWMKGASSSGQAAALVTAGVAVALQRVITSFAAYLVIIRDRVFAVGDRITIGGVRGDVVELGFIQTRVMEMGQAKGEQGDDPSVWVGGRQYTGRIVSVTNDKIFDLPVYNYTRQFPFLWEELKLPVKYSDDRAKAEEILLGTAMKHTATIREKADPARNKLLEKYSLKAGVELEPRVYWTLTDNWLELSVRFIAEDTGVRELKDAMSREILAGLEQAKIGIASSTFGITDVPPVTVRLEQRD
jgi:small-conductance mechanosensitive channel